MTLHRLALATATVLLGATGCGDASAGRADDATSTTPSSPAAATEPATAGGLAAAVTAHLDGVEVTHAVGGLTDMEDQRFLGVELRLGRDRDRLSVQAHDPSYLPGDRGEDECDGGTGRKEKHGAVVDCSVLDDGTVVIAYSMPGEHGGDPGTTWLMAQAEGPTRSVQISARSRDAAATLDLDDVIAIAEDPLVGWRTSSELNAAGEELDVEVRDEVHRG